MCEEVEEDTKAQSSAWVAIHYHEPVQMKWHRSSRMSIKLTMEVVQTVHEGRHVTKVSKTWSVFIYPCQQQERNVRFSISRNIPVFIFLQRFNI